MQHSNRFWQGVRKVYARYDRLMEKQGFYIVLVLCVLIILLSALYTFHFREEWAQQPANVSDDEIVMAGGMQDAQTLQQAQALVESMNAQAVAVPTRTPYRFVQPVNGFLDRDFSMDEPQLFQKANYWRVHPGIDLQAAYATPVHACASGKVMNVWQDHEKGLCIQLSHEHGYETLYAGLSDASYVRAGDPVAQGQTIGHVGNGVVAEADAQPHLHFEVWRGGSPLDPVELFLGTDD